MARNASGEALGEGPHSSPSPLATRVGRGQGRGTRGALLGGLPAATMAANGRNVVETVSCSSSPATRFTMSDSARGRSLVSRRQTLKSLAGAIIVPLVGGRLGRTQETGEAAGEA